VVLLRHSFLTRPLTTQPPTENAMNTAALTKLAIALGATYAAYKFIPNQSVKAAALGVMGVIVAKQVPYVNEAL
jgi:hypothetical protein